MQSFCSVQNLLSLPEFIRTFHTRPSGGFPIFLYGVPSQARKSAITSHTHDLIQPIYSLQGGEAWQGLHSFLPLYKASRKGWIGRNHHRPIGLCRARLHNHQRAAWLIDIAGQKGFESNLEKHKLSFTLSPLVSVLARDTTRIISTTLSLSRCCARLFWWKVLCNHLRSQLPYPSDHSCRSLSLLVW